MKPIPYGRQTITDDDVLALTSALKSDFLTQGPQVAEFERAFAKYIGAKYAVAVANGTAALHLSALALEVKPGQRVITSPITFVASANCVRYAGGEIDFADIDPQSYCLDLEAVRELLQHSPKGTYAGIVPVDFAGYPVDLEAFRALADEFGLWLLEDSCHSPGGWFTDSNLAHQRCGNGAYADLAIFSFHPVKHIATGEGGMITTNSEELYNKLLLLRTHGITKDPQLILQNPGGWYYEQHELGYNYRLTDFQCALGISQLARAEEGMTRRHAIAHRYTSAFQGTMVSTPQIPSGIHHAYHLYVVQVPDRLGLYNHLKKNNIHAQVHYIPVHLQPYYASRGEWKQGSFPVAEAYYDHCLSLPMYPALTDAEQDYVIEQVMSFVK